MHHDHELDLTTQPPKSRRLRAAVFVGVGVLLTWQVLTRTLAAYVAETSPAMALRLNPNQPSALLQLADKALAMKPPAKQPPADDTDPAPENGDRVELLSKSASAALGPAAPGSADPVQAVPVLPPLDPETTAIIKAQAQAALRQDPLSARPLRILAQLAERNSDPASTATLMLAASKRSLRESQAINWLMQRSLEANDITAALGYADVLLRSRPQVVQYVVPTLARIAEHRKGNGELKRLLASNVPWRPAFLYYLPASITDARTPLDLLISLRQTPTPPKAIDLMAYIDFLIAKNFHELAYYAWLQFLPAEQLRSVGLLFNGGFEHAPSGLPFDWVIPKGKGTIVDRVKRTDAENNYALAIDFGIGRVDFKPITQIVLLAPGNYQLTGTYKGQVSGRRGLVWRITCVESAKPIAETPMLLGPVREWTDFELGFTIMPGCRAQQIRLELDARSSSEQLVSGTMWFDDMKLRRVAAE
jgi:hypothetical protein